MVRFKLIVSSLFVNSPFARSWGVGPSPPVLISSRPPQVLTAKWCLTTPAAAWTLGGPMLGTLVRTRSPACTGPWCAAACSIGFAGEGAWEPPGRDGGAWKGQWPQEGEKARRTPDLAALCTVLCKIPFF